MGQKKMIAGLLGCVLHSGAAMAGACDASSPEAMAAAYGVEATAVQEELTYERKTTSECLWTFTDADGFEVSVSYRSFDKTDKITNPDFFKNGQQYVVDHGKKVGKTELTYRFEAFPNTEHGVVSDLYGSKYTRTLHYIWVEGEERRLGVTYNVSVNDAGAMREPTLEDIKKAVDIFTD